MQENQQPNVQNLIEQAKAGNSQAFDELHRQFLTPVYRYIYIRVQNKQLAEDLCQTVFVKFYQSLAKFEASEKSPLAYFFTIARNTVIDHARKNKQRPIDDAEDELLRVPDGKPTPHREMEIQEDGALVRAALKLLTPEQREVVTLKFLIGLPNREIAQTLGKTEEAVRQLQSRGLKALKKILEQHL
jgi:RNA polymerase sigma-70 factor (ECF subfamily)